MAWGAHPSARVAVGARMCFSVCRRKAALPRRTPKPVGISEAADERASVLECGASAPFFSRDAKQIPAPRRLLPLVP
jgi:hypothetical protein